MVEPPGTRPPVQAATEEELLATKLHIAEPRPGFLPRPLPGGRSRWSVECQTSVAP